MTDTDLQLLRDNLSQLRRKVEEVEECAQQALSVSSAANLRLTELRAVINRLEARIDGLKIEAHVIAEVIG